MHAGSSHSAGYMMQAVNTAQDTCRQTGHTVQDTLHEFRQFTQCRIHVGRQDTQCTIHYMNSGSSHSAGYI
jgi:hypothetical protein